VKRALVILAVLVVVQALLVGLWLAVDAGREATVEREVAARRTTALDRPAPELVLRAASGGTSRLSERRGRPLVLHFWATWCPPCREELPDLLAFGAETGTPVLAVSLDPDRADVERLLGAALPPEVAFAPGDAVERGFEVHALPVTFVVDRAGVLRLRLDGARDWAAPELRSRVLDAQGER